MTGAPKPRWSKVEGTTLAALALIALSVFGFLRLAGYARGDEVHDLDASLLRSMRSTNDLSDPLGPQWFEEGVRDVTALGGMTLLTLLTAAVLGYLISIRRMRTALLLFVAVLGGALISFGLKELFGRVRPDVVPHLAKVSTKSFPSGHAMISAVVYLTMGAMLAEVQTRWWLRLYVLAVAVLLTLLVGTSRVYLGVHWPSDVAAGFALGSAWAGLAWLVERRLQGRGKIEPPPPMEDSA